MKSIVKYVIISTIFICSSKVYSQSQEAITDSIEIAIQELNSKNHVRSLELLTKIKKIAEKNHWHKELFLAYNNIGLNYYLMLDYGEALKHYLHAHKISIEHLEPHDEVIVLNNIAVLYYKERDLKIAESYFKKAYDIALKANDNQKIHLYATNVASIAASMGDAEKAEKYIQVSFRYLKEPDANYYIARTVKAKILSLKKQNKASIALCLNDLPKLKDAKYQPAKIGFLKLLSELYLEEKNYKNAIYYAQQIANDPFASIQEKFISYQYLAEIYIDANDLQTSIKYKDSMFLAKDSLNQVKNGQVYENSRIKFELQNKEHELVVSQEKFQRERNIFIGALIASFVLLISIIIALFNYLARVKQRKIISENNRKIIELELEKERNQKALLEKELEEQNTKSLLEKQILKNELDNKNRKLTAKALSMSARNELIEKVIQELSHNVDVVQNSQLKKQIQTLKNHLKDNKEWDEFFTHFEEVNQGFIKNLKETHPELNVNDLRFISYMYMNLTTKEIASLLNITFEACRKRKERIAKKINLPENMDFYDYITQF